MRLRQVLLISLVALFVFATPVFAQVVGPTAPNQSPKPESSGMKMNVEMVLVNVSVIDPDKRMITSLEKENFHIYEDGVEQEISTFSSEDVPMSIGLIFDMSGSMARKLDMARQAAIQFLHTANPRDEFFLVSFSDHAELTSGFTSKFEELERRMIFTMAKGHTALLDAVYLALSEMRSAENGKRALLIISDGGDNHSRYNEMDLRNSLKEADCQLYAIGIFNGTVTGSPEEEYGPTLLSELAEITGGQVFSPWDKTDLLDIATKIGMELRSQYVLGYRSTNSLHNGAWRKIKVTLRAPKGLPPVKVYAKTGYYSPTR